MIATPSRRTRTYTLRALFVGALLTVAMPLLAALFGFFPAEVGNGVMLPALVIAMGLLGLAGAAVILGASRLVAGQGTGSVPRLRLLGVLLVLGCLTAVGFVYTLPGSQQWRPGSTVFCIVYGFISVFAVRIVWTGGLFPEKKRA